MKSTLAAIIASTVDAYFNCCVPGRENPEWKERHLAALEKAVKDGMPSGSGWDSGTKLEVSRSSRTKLYFFGSYHHMNDVGMYDGWTDHAIIVTPTFGGIDIRVTGRNRNDIKDYLHDVFHAALTEEYYSHQFYEVKEAAHG